MSPDRFSMLEFDDTAIDANTGTTHDDSRVTTHTHEINGAAFAPENGGLSARASGLVTSSHALAAKADTGDRECIEGRVI